MARDMSKAHSEERLVRTLARIARVKACLNDPALIVEARTLLIAYLGGLKAKRDRLRYHLRIVAKYGDAPHAASAMPAGTPSDDEAAPADRA